MRKIDNYKERITQYQKEVDNPPKVEDMQVINEELVRYLLNIYLPQHSVRYSEQATLPSRLSQIGSALFRITKERSLTKRPSSSRRWKRIKDSEHFMQRIYTCCY